MSDGVVQGSLSSRTSDRLVQFVFVIYNRDGDNRFLLQTDNDIQADTLS